MASEKMVEIGPASPQGASPLMRIPQEVRNNIYSHLFRSTRFISGEGYIEDCSHIKRATSAPHGLAMLYSCRQAYLEIDQSWISQVMFCFESLEAILDKFANIPLAKRSLIRHVRVISDDMVLEGPHFRGFPLKINQVLSFLPGLKLDRLIVIGTEEALYLYDLLESMVKSGDGWKELYFLSATSYLLGFSCNPDDLWCRSLGRVTQPAGWQRNLESRDGSDSGASVTIYRSPDVNLHRQMSITNLTAWPGFTQTLSAGQSEDDYLEVECRKFCAWGERLKEMLVVVKRGRGADYETKQSLAFTKGDLRDWFQGMSWNDTKRTYRGWTEIDDGTPIVVDDYINVDDYKWLRQSRNDLY